MERAEKQPNTAPVEKRRASVGRRCAWLGMRASRTAVVAHAAIAAWVLGAGATEAPSSIHVHRAVIWGHGRVSGGRKPQLTNLHSSIKSVSLLVHDAALVLLHDGELNCTSMNRTSSRSTPCEDFARRRPLVPSTSCRLGPQSLEANMLYLVRVDPIEENLDRARNELFSYRTDKATHVGSTKHAMWIKPSRKVNESQLNRLGNANTSRYGEVLGYGAWFRYVAHHYLMPVGIRQVLYLDADTCAIRPLGALFDINTTVPLVVSRRAVPQWKLRYWLKEKYTDVPLARKLWGFSEWSAAPHRDGKFPADEVHMFNNGVMLMNLLPYCTVDIWGRMRNLTHHHATRSRIFGPLDRVKEFGDNQAIEIVGAAHSHMVGTEWNCRHFSALKTLKNGDGVPCRIRHLHEEELWKQAGGGITCKQIIAKLRSEQPRGPRLQGGKSAT